MDRDERAKKWHGFTIEDCDFGRLLWRNGCWTARIEDPLTGSFVSLDFYENGEDEPLPPNDVDRAAWRRFVSEAGEGRWPEAVGKMRSFLLSEFDRMAQFEGRDIGIEEPAWVAEAKDRLVSDAKFKEGLWCSGMSICTDEGPPILVSMEFETPVDEEHGVGLFFLDDGRLVAGEICSGPDLS